MDEKATPLVSPDDHEAFLVGMASTVLRNWRMVFVLPFVLAIVVGIWSLTRDRMYAATAAFVPQTAESRASGGAAALAQQFGFSLGSERPGQNPQFYVDLLRSRTLLREAVEAKYSLTDRDGAAWEGTLIEYWEFDRRRGALPPWRRASEELRSSVSPLVTRETGVVRMAVSVDHPLLAEQIAGKLLALLNQRNVELRQTRALEEVRFISGRMEEASAELVRAESALQNFLKRNREFRNSPELLFEHERLQRELLMRQEVYTALLQSQEQARIDGVRDTPLFTVLDDPAGTAEPLSRGTVKKSLVAFLIGVILSIGAAVVAEFGRRRRESGDPAFREFQDVARSAWHDARHPGRWVRRRSDRSPRSDHSVAQ